MDYKYRSEIDGLRSIAVIPVILFHAGFEVFSGGFVGVDVFFVISGYLITTIILSEMDKGQFSLVNFYERRARRIFPALFFVMLVSLLPAWLYLNPSELKDFSQSLMAVSAFSSNILFWAESGYWGADNELKPLLHTWSLGVEEQYYILFPLFLMVMWRFRKRWILSSFVAISVVSLLTAQWGAYNNPTATFFLLPTRAWELAIGSCIAFYFLYRKQSIRTLLSHRYISEALSLAGLLMIGYAIFAFDETTPFPSFFALIPTIGTGLIIIFSSKEVFVGKLLSTKLLVGIGLISYSAYLWHQPLFAFARHASFTPSNTQAMAFIAILSFVFAYLSWRLVEKPFRDKSVVSRKTVLWFAVAGSVSFLTLGLVGHLGNGFPERFSASTNSVLDFNNYPKKELYRQRDCFLEPDQRFSEFSSFCHQVGSRAGVMIWGDSHAAALSYGLRKELSDVIQLTSSGCPPIFGLHVPYRIHCTGINEFAKEIIEKHQPKIIILHANWLFYQDTYTVYDVRKLGELIKKTIRSVSELSPDSEIYIVGGVPQWKGGLPNLLHKKDIGLDRERSLYLEDGTLNALAALDLALSESTTNLNATFVSVFELLCDSKNCPVVILGDKGYTLTAWDYGHLTAEGSSLLANKIILQKRFR